VPGVVYRIVNKAIDRAQRSGLGAVESPTTAAQPRQAWPGLLALRPGGAVEGKAPTALGTRRAKLESRGRAGGWGDGAEKGRVVLSRPTLLYTEHTYLPWFHQPEVDNV